MHIFIRGERGVGKSTLVDAVVSALRAHRVLRVGGCMTYKHGDGDVYIAPAAVPRTAITDAVRLGAPGSDACEAFDVYAPRLLASARGCDLIVLDELGAMERSATSFQEAVMRCFASGVPVLGVVKSKPVSWCARLLARDDVVVLDLDERGRAGFGEKIVRLLEDALL